MRALVIDAGCDELVPVELPDPVAGPGEALVAVRAAGVNRADLAARAGTRNMGDGRSPERQVAGLELAGEVVAVGPDVGWPEVGDRVMGRGPGYAELAAVDRRLLMPVPESFTWEEAGATPVALVTAHDALSAAGRLAPGGSVLVQAATSGVGVAGIRMAARLGASVVFATSRRSSKLATLAEHLADLVCPLVCVDSTRDDVVDVVTERTGGRGVDVVLDNIGGSALADNLAVAGLDGRIVQVGRVGGKAGQVDLDELARKRLSLTGVSSRARTPDQLAEVAERCRHDLGDCLEPHRPRIDSAYRLDHAREAQDALAADEHVGKIVLVP